MAVASSGDPSGRRVPVESPADGARARGPRLCLDSPLVPSTTATDVRCRCGTRVPSGGEVFAIASRPPLAWTVLNHQRFCSARCARAHCLELIEQLDALDTVAARATLVDLHEVIREIALVLEGLLEP